MLIYYQIGEQTIRIGNTVLSLREHRGYVPNDVSAMIYDWMQQESFRLIRYLSFTYNQPFLILQMNHRINCIRR